MRRLRTLSKSCPKCEAGVAVASRICGECGFAFARQTRSSVTTTPSTSSSGVQKKGETKAVAEQRRTGRVRIAKKPNYYDSQEFEKKKKKERVTRGKNIFCNRKGKEETTKVKETTEARAKRRRAKKEEEEGRDMLEKIPIEKQELAKIILSEINRKMFSVVWKPSD
ncbi:uncharacterized protein LOC134830584 [Culicoides brevitarsis]|uniref:uncharacterized protein LOC134830584 n=1 Tax=Culicoides brevitarsis TaxID=469753 RepID=UPI00307C45AA